MLAELPARLWYEWQVYYQVEPFGEERADLRIAQLAAVIANIYKKKNARWFGIKDFMLKFKRQRRKKWQELLAIVEQMNQMLGGDDLRSEEQKNWEDAS